MLIIDVTTRAVGSLKLEGHAQVRRGRRGDYENSRNVQNPTGRIAGAQDCRTSTHVKTDHRRNALSIYTTISIAGDRTLGSGSLACAIKASAGNAPATHAEGAIVGTKARRQRANTIQASAAVAC